jgi:hypothetical protein
VYLQSEKLERISEGPVRQVTAEYTAYGLLYNDGKIDIYQHQMKSLNPNIIDDNNVQFNDLKNVESIYVNTRVMAICDNNGCKHIHMFGISDTVNNYSMAELNKQLSRVRGRKLCGAVGYGHNFVYWSSEELSKSLLFFFKVLKTHINSNAYSDIYILQ